MQLYRHLQNIARRVSNIRNRRRLITGCLYQGTYRNFKNDPRPLIFIFYSDNNITHAININYLSGGQKTWFTNFIISIYNDNKIYNGYMLYQVIKRSNYNIVKTAYRKYKTNLLKMKIVSYGINKYTRIPLYSTMHPFINNINKSLKPQALRHDKQETIKEIRQIENRERFLNKAERVVKQIPTNIRQIVPGYRPVQMNQQQQTSQTGGNNNEQL